MVGAVVGDIDIAETKKILTQYFGDIPAGKVLPDLQDPEPPQKEEKRQWVSFDARRLCCCGQWHRGAERRHSG